MDSRLCRGPGYHAHYRHSDDRAELLTTVDLMADFTESITHAALGL